MQPVRRWGFTAEEWDVLVAEARRVLAEVASRRGTITYGELAARVTPGRLSARSAGLFALLDDVCVADETDRGIVIAALVVRRDTGMPGEGYFADMPGADSHARARRWRADAENVWNEYRAG